jgi:nitrogen fixation/metabolism regulation signal transduction histidine kinase
VSPSAKPPAGRHQRSAKNYLIDRNFQLKYAGYLAGVALALSLGLGAVLYRTSSKVIEQSQHTVEEGRETVKQGQETVELGKKVIDESRKVNAVVAMNISDQYKDNPELAKVFGEDSAQKQKDLNAQQAKLEAQAVDLKKRSTDLEAQAAAVVFQQQAVLIGIVAGLALLVIAIGLAGIVVTHKIAGPLFKMKRLLRQVGEGKLVVRERLRKGDELQHFFETFERMVEDMRARQREEIGKLDAGIARVAAGEDGRVEGLELLNKLRADMQDHIEA